MKTSMLVVVLALGVRAPAHVQAHVQAQTADRASFFLVSHTPIGTLDTITAERRTRTPTALTGEMVNRVRGGRLTYEAALAPDGLITKLVIREFAGADSVGTATTLELAGDSIVVRRGAAPAMAIHGAAGALMMLNPSVAFMEQAAIHARTSGGDSTVTPAYFVGAPRTIPIVVRRIGADSSVLQIAATVTRLATTPGGEVRGGVIPSQRIQIVRGAADAQLAAAPRDYSAPPGAPYTAEEVTVTSAAGLHFSGTLTVPRVRRGRVPAVVTITGSGSEDRDEASTALEGYRPFRELADTLGRRGIAVLRLDDRGVNRSDVGPATATSQDFADDIRAGVAYLRTRAEIDPDRIALVGHSEGGIIAPMVAVTDPRIRAIVLMAGTASTGREILHAQQLYAIDSMAHLTGAARAAALAQSARATDSIGAAQPWMRFFLDYAPDSLARRVRTPVLILQGETDRQVPPSEAEKLAQAFRAGGNTHVTVRRFPATNHLFVADPTGSFAYDKLPSLRVRPEVLGAIADWLTSEFR